MTADLSYAIARLECSVDAAFADRNDTWIDELAGDARAVRASRRARIRSYIAALRVLRVLRGHEAMVADMAKMRAALMEANEPVVRSAFRQWLHDGKRGRDAR
jgi:hypothetical protein